MARSVVEPCAWIIWTIGNTLAAKASASARCEAAHLAASRLAWETKEHKRFCRDGYRPGPARELDLRETADAQAG